MIVQRTYRLRREVNSGDRIGQLKSVLKSVLWGDYERFL